VYQGDKMPAHARGGDRRHPGHADVREQSLHDAQRGLGIRRRDHGERDEPRHLVIITPIIGGGK
jgi:hypothetical protein